jgi:hypothetical protein
MSIIFGLCSGIVATVFGATGFLGRYLVQQLGEMIRLLCYLNWFLNRITNCQILFSQDGISSACSVQRL